MIRFVISICVSKEVQRFPQGYYLLSGDKIIGILNPDLRASDMKNYMLIRDIHIGTKHDINSPPDILSIPHYMVHTAAVLAYKVARRVCLKVLPCES